MSDTGTILALDVGSARIGLALASNAARLASPRGALIHDEATIDQLRELCHREGVTHLVIGLPRGMSGQDTKQTALVQEFGDNLAHELGIPMTWQDEAVTSVRAEEELRARGKLYSKG